jgi:putative toxin-antitoxin system antitoxin component (TIGR02293 family)
LPVGATEALERRITVGDEFFARLLGVSERTLRRVRAANARLDPVASDRLIRVARISALAIHWLKRRQLVLGRSSPIDLLTTDGGCAEVEKLLLRIEHGVVA